LYCRRAGRRPDQRGSQHSDRNPGHRTPLQRLCTSAV
jgi:hypothetical protein